jgi:hypothetical protein
MDVKLYFTQSSGKFWDCIAEALACSKAVLITNKVNILGRLKWWRWFY